MEWASFLCENGPFHSGLDIVVKRNNNIDVTHDPMSARRRRVGSESEQAPLIVTTGGPYPAQDSRPRISYYNGSELRNHHLEGSPLKQVNTKNNHTMSARDRTTEFVNAIRSLQVAKRKSLFNDRPTEIQELTYIIKEDLNSLNLQIAKLQDISRNQRQSQENGKHLLSHSSSVVLALQSKLATMSSEFKQVLEVRTENLKQQKSRREQFSQGPVSSSLPPSAISGHHQGSVLMSEDVSLDMEPNNQLVPAVQKQVMIYDETDNYLQSRAETMQNIESTIVELGGIFQQLAVMVKEQEEMVERIDTNVQDAELNVEAAHGEILKYFQSVTSNRWLMIKIFAVLICFFLFFVIFLA
uniref:t-SNARE coiled-coil homology domain-containing protein n=1 Tax=Timema shepardi TaxID=629360 RepID=A0A7R9FYH1_TIMSH|nr:unnamed protein product [Timema shepardi]